MGLGSRQWKQACVTIRTGYVYVQLQAIERIVIWGVFPAAVSQKIDNDFEHWPFRRHQMIFFKCPVVSMRAECLRSFLHWTKVDSLQLHLIQNKAGRNWSKHAFPRKSTNQRDYSHHCFISKTGFARRSCGFRCTLVIPLYVLMNRVPFGFLCQKKFQTNSGENGKSKYSSVYISRGAVDSIFIYRRHLRYSLVLFPVRQCKYVSMSPWNEPNWFFFHLTAQLAFRMNGLLKRPLREISFVCLIKVLQGPRQIKRQCKLCINFKRVLSRKMIVIQRLSFRQNFRIIDEQPQETWNMSSVSFLWFRISDSCVITGAAGLSRFPARVSSSESCFQTFSTKPLDLASRIWQTTSGMLNI